MDKIRSVDRQGFVREYLLTGLTLVLQRKTEPGYKKDKYEEVERGEVKKRCIVTRHRYFGLLTFILGGESELQRWRLSFKWFR